MDRPKSVHDISIKKTFNAPSMKNCMWGIQFCYLSRVLVIPTNELGHLITFPTHTITISVFLTNEGTIKEFITFLTHSVLSCAIPELLEI